MFDAFLDLLSKNRNLAGLLYKKSINGSRPTVEEGFARAACIPGQCLEKVYEQSKTIAGVSAIMSATIHSRALVIFFALNAFFWVLWGSICLFNPLAWSGQVIPGMDVFDLSQAIARTEVRAMYGGLQIAIGLLALVAIFHPTHRATALLLFVLALSGLSLARALGLVLEGAESIILFSVEVTPENYNQVALGAFELPILAFAWLLFLSRPRSPVTGA